MLKYYFCSMQLIDSHTHLYVSQFDDDREEVLARAIKEGIDTFLIPAIDASYYERMRSLQEMAPKKIHLMAGLHPTHVKENHQEELAVVKAELESHTYCAVGEIGIDLYWDTRYLKEQQEAFALQIQWAIERDLPIVIHCREAFDEVFEVLERFRSENIKGIFHCFTGTKKQALEAIDHNLLLGIGGVVTFKNGKIDQFLSEIPLPNIVLETDSPYLAPVPYRGKRNESSYLSLVLAKVATVYGCSKSEVALQTTENIHRIFSL